jgi:hypothetical protein
MRGARIFLRLLAPEMRVSRLAQRSRDGLVWRRAAGASEWAAASLSHPLANWWFGFAGFDATKHGGAAGWIVFFDDWWAIRELKWVRLGLEANRGSTAGQPARDPETHRQSKR